MEISIVIVLAVDGQDENGHSLKKKLGHFFKLLLLVLEYCKIPIISPGLIFVQKAFLLSLFLGALLSDGLIIGRNFAFQNGLGLIIKTA